MQYLPRSSRRHGKDDAPRRVAQADPAGDHESPPGESQSGRSSTPVPPAGTRAPSAAGCVRSDSGATTVAASAVASALRSTMHRPPFDVASTAARQVTLLARIASTLSSTRESTRSHCSTLACRQRQRRAPGSPQTAAPMLSEVDARRRPAVCRVRRSARCRSVDHVVRIRHERQTNIRRPDGTGSPRRVRPGLDGGMSRGRGSPRAILHA